MDDHQVFQQATKKRITALFAKDGKNAVRDYSTKNRSKELKRLASSMDIDVPKLKALLKKQRTKLSKVDPEKAAYIDWIMDSKSQGESSKTNKRNRKPSMEEKKDDDDVVSTRNTSNEKPKAKKRVVRPKRISKAAEEQNDEIEKDEEITDGGDAVVDPSLLSDVKFEDVQMNPKTKRALTQTLKLSSMTEIQSKTFAAATKGEMRKINEVRMSHGVITISDITTADGRRIDPVFLHRSVFEGDRNNFNWPDKHDIRSKDYKVWIKAMHMIFPQGINMYHTLYQWQLESASDWIDQWNWFRTRDGTRLLYREDDIWFSYSQHLQSRTRFTTDHNAAQRPDPNTIERVTVEYDGEFSHVTQTSSVFTLLNSNRERMRLGRYTIYLPRIPYLFQFIKMSDDIDILLRDIADGTALCVGDGSYFEHMNICTSGWIICSQDGMQWIKGGGYIPGLEKDLNSYRGEIGSLVGIVNCIEALTPLLQPTQASIISASDNDSAVECLHLKRFHLKSSTTSVDLISSLIELWEEVPYSPQPTKVKGHADELYRPLTFLEHLNCIADDYAKEIATYYFTALPPTDFSREVGISTIKIDAVNITSNLTPAITSVLDKRTVCDYWSEVTGVSSTILQQDIGWTSIRRARKERSFKQNRFITKLMANDLPTGTNLEKRQHSNTSLCPCCKIAQETTVHLMSCPDTNCFRETLLTEFDTFMASIDTEPQLRNFLVAGIRSWMDNPDRGIIPVNLSRDFLPIASKQNNVGWYSTILGFIHKDIIRYQHTYYNQLQSRRTGTAWAKHVITKLWNMTYQMWAERNRLLHNTSTIDEFRGLESLERSIKIELSRGLRSLPRSIYSHHFRLDPNTIQDLSTETKKEWLLLIRRFQLKI